VSWSILLVVFAFGAVLGCWSVLRRLRGRRYLSAEDWVCVEKLRQEKAKDL